MLLYTQPRSLFLDLVDARACAADAVGGWYAGMVPGCGCVVGICWGLLRCVRYGAVDAVREIFR